MSEATIPSVPIGANGLEGWSSCCEASVTYHMEEDGSATLCCKSCWQEVMPVLVEGSAGERLGEVVRRVIDQEIEPEEGVRLQREVLA